MFGTIVVGVDGSGHADRALRVVRNLAGLTDDKVVVIHVREGHFTSRGGMFATEDAGEAQRIVDRGVAALAGIAAYGEVHEAATSDVAAALVNAATGHGAGLIALGTRGRGEVTAVLVGSVARRVLHQSYVPVLVVPDKSE